MAGAPSQVKEISERRAEGRHPAAPHRHAEVWLGDAFPDCRNGAILAGTERQAGYRTA